MTNYNIITKQWQEPISFPKLEDIQAIVGEIAVTFTSNGDITIDKELTADEKAKFEALIK